MGNVKLDNTIFNPQHSMNIFFCPQADDTNFSREEIINYTSQGAPKEHCVLRKVKG